MWFQGSHIKKSVPAHERWGFGGERKYCPIHCKEMHAGCAWQLALTFASIDTNTFHFEVFPMRDLETTEASQANHQTCTFERNLQYPVKKEIRA